MKLRTFIIVLVTLVSAWAFADNFIVITFNNGTVTEEQVNTSTEELTFSRSLDSLLFSNGNKYNLSDISNIGFRYSEPAVQDNGIVYVTWNGTETPTISNSASGVTATINGTDVTLTNTNTDTEYTYVLSGEAEAGSFTLVASYKSTIQLNGLNLKSTLEEAVNIKCGKRIKLVLVDGTTNTLEDATANNGQKGALYCKGHLEVSGSGTLNLKGNIKHALATKEYLELKKTTGTINIISAANDGIHAGQYFQMNGGNISIDNVGGDGIQAEATGDEGDELDGQMIIKAGTLNITVTADDAAALKSDSLMTINGGTFTIKSSGKGSKGLKSKTSVEVNGGSMSINNSGGLYDEPADDTSAGETPKSYKVYVSIPASSGGWGGSTSAWTTVALYKEDGTLVSNLTDKKTITAGYTTTTFYYYDFNEPTTGNYYFRSADYRSTWGSSTTYTIQSSTFSAPTSGTDVYYSISNSYSTSGTKRTYSMTNVTSTYTGGTSTTEGDLKSSHGIKADNNIVINGGDITINISGAAGKAISSDYDIIVNNGTLNLTNSGAGYTEGTTNYTAKAFTADRYVMLISGDITIKMSGSGGKGIKADKNIVIGDSNTMTGPTLSVSTTGARLGATSGGGGWGGQTSSGSSAKAIKCEGSYYQYGGNIYVSTTGNGAEGIESKTASTTSMNFNGGNLFINVYDDCISSAGQINFAGANVICYSTANDAIDSNYGRAGSITVSAGTVLCFSQRGGMEMGIDADNMAYVKVSGGTLIAGGGSQGGSSSTTIGSGSTHYKAWSGTVSYTQGRYYSIVCNGNNIMTFLMPCTLSSTYNVYASDAFTSNITHIVYNGTTAPTSGTSQSFINATSGALTPMIWKASNITTGTQTTSFSPN